MMAATQDTTFLLFKEQKQKSASIFFRTIMWQSTSHLIDAPILQVSQLFIVSLQIEERNKEKIFFMNYTLHLIVMLCRWSAKQTIPLSVLAQNQTKGLDSRSRRDRKWVRECEWGVGRRNPQKAVVDGRRRLADEVDTGQQLAWDRVQGSEGRPVKMGWHS